MVTARYPCTINGVHHESGYAAAKTLEMRVNSLRYHLRASDYPEYTSRYHARKEHRKHFIPYTVAGVEYASITDASKKLGVSVYGMERRLASTDYPNYICAVIPRKSPPSPKYSVRGKPYKTLQEIADKEGAAGREFNRK